MSMTEPSEAEVGFVADLAVGHWKTAIVHALARFDICDAIQSLAGEGAGDDGAFSGDVAAKCGTHPRTTYRLLRAASTLGLVEERPKERFTLTGKGKLLTADHPKSMKHFLQFIGDGMNRRIWMEFDTCVLEGRKVISKIYGVDNLWEVLKLDAAEAALFNAAMTENTRAEMHSLLDLYDFGWARSLVDLAGGHGLTAFSILERYPELHATVVDLPAVCHTAVVPDALSARATFRPFDLFDGATYPVGADAYLVKNTLRDWDDDHCLTILKNVATVLGPDSRLLIAEAGILPPNQPGFGKMLDLHMLICLDGVERTEPDWRRLAAAAGLAVRRVVQTPRHLVVELGREK